MENVTKILFIILAVRVATSKSWLLIIHLLLVSQTCCIKIKLFCTVLLSNEIFLMDNITFITYPVCVSIFITSSLGVAVGLLSI